MEVSDQLEVYFPEGRFPSRCPSRTVLEHVTSKWGVLVLVALSRRTLRWSELRRQVEGVSEKMLAQTLQTLEGDGLVHREARPVIPPHVDYSLTPLGRDLVARLIPLLTWIGAHADEILSGKAATRRAATGGRRPGGRRPDPQDVFLKMS
jgi:DNA-binding HxlR family transcriptional regulator